MGGSGQGDFVQDVRQAADIGRLIGEYVPLKTAGRKLKGLCPFHQEKTPSFVVDPEKQLFYCFGCQTGGDTFKFYMLMERLDFGDALRQLAGKFGVPIPRSERRDAGESSRLLEMHREASELFRAALAGPQGARAREYLQQRGLSQATIDDLGVGYAPPGWENLKGKLRTSGYREDELIKGGLVVKGKKGGTYDWFRDRIVFPIERVGGGIIGFGGRLLGDGEPKYLNSPETPIFNKGRHLYGLARSREAVRDERCICVVEGYMDFAGLWEAGVRNVAAVLGTGFTPEHGKLLRRFASSVVLNFDADRAGRQAADRAIGVLLEQEFDVRVLELAEGEDPDDFVRAQGADAYRSRVAEAPTFIDYLIRSAAGEHDLQRPEGRARAVGEVLPRLSGIRNRVLLATALDRVADRFDVPAEAVRAEFHRLRARGMLGGGASEAPPPPGVPAESRGLRPGRETPAERRLLQILLSDAESREGLLARVSEEAFAGLATERLFAALLSQSRAGHEVSVSSLETILPPEERRQLLEIAMADTLPAGLEEAESCWNAIERERLQRESHQLQRQIQQGVESKEATAQVDDLLRRKLELRKRIDALS